MVDNEIPEPGTLEDLLEDARRAGWTDVGERTRAEWNRLGLLGSPRRRPRTSGGSGQEPALYSSQQRALFQTIVRSREASRRSATPAPFPAHKHSALASIPVYAWVRFGDSWVDNEQLRRALRTALGPNPKKSMRAARLAATQFVDALDIADAPIHARHSLRDFIADQLWRGRSVDVDQLRAHVAAVVEPQQLSVVRGPVDSTMFINSATYAVKARVRAALALSTITDEQLGVARLRYNASRPGYEAFNAAIRPGLDPGLVKLFDDVGSDNEIRGIVSALLLLLGMDLLEHDGQTS